MTIAVGRAAPAPGAPSFVNGLAEIRARHRDGKAALLARFAAARPTTRAALLLVRSLAGEVDGTLIALWQKAGMPDGTALVAVGGYGRGELFPHSDVDVLVLFPGDDIVGLEGRSLATERLIADCWDAGLEIGSSVRTVAECVDMAASDVTVQTALLESRLLCGDRKIFSAFQKATAAAMDAKAFLR
ncbi:MAG: nucleotidyltransferase domain-containing protein, partial [Caldimonas sp.]